MDKVLKYIYIVRIFFRGMTLKSGLTASIWNYRGGGVNFVYNVM